MVSISKSLASTDPHASSKSSGAPALALPSSCAALVGAQRASRRQGLQITRRTAGGSLSLAHDAVNTNRAGSPLVVGQDVQTHGDHAQGLT